MSRNKLTDYTVYLFTLKDWVVMSILILLLVFMFGLILFDNIIIGIVFTVCSSPFVYTRLKKYLKLKRREKLEKQFCEVLHMIASSLSAGQSLSGAINEIAYSDLGDYLLIRKEFKNIQRLVSLNIQPEEAIYAFAKRSGSKDILNFANALYASISAGSNMVWLVRNCASTLRVKYDAEEEIKLILNLPKYNHRIMMLMPFFMIVMMKLIAPGYVEPLYTVQGRAVMIFVALMILLSWFIGEKISDIKL